MGPSFALALSLLLIANIAFSAIPHPIANKANCLFNASLEISLFASEPDVVDPVSMTFDESGRAYVVEMRDYPYGIGLQHKPGGTVRLLEDTNHDGRADRSTLFAENLSFPTSICMWNGGVLVTCPPEIIYLKDTDGDGRADVREVMFKGFTLGVTDSNVNGLRWGLDNRIHGLNGGNGGQIISVRKSGRSTPLGSLDFSFDPGSGDFATTYHSSRGFGLVFDEWGRSFSTYNINHIQQRFIPERYLRRFPGFPSLRATSSISDHGDMARIFPVSLAETRPNHPEQSGHFSSAGGMGYVGWDGYGPELYGSVLVCDVVGNLVHRDVLKKSGPIFQAVRSAAEQETEFLASHDNAFRPVGLELGPDGALYLLDMQRDVIEHPDYIPEKIRSTLNLRAGEDRGRIYRLVPKGARPEFVDLASAPIATLVKNLSHPIQARRTTAQRLIVERQMRDGIPALRKLAQSRAQPLGRLHALWTLQGLKALDDSLVEQGLSDPHEGIRENALILAEPFLSNTKLVGRVCALARDPSARVRFQAALTLGQVQGTAARDALKSILKQDYEFRWTRAAVLSSMESGAADVLTEFHIESQVVTNLSAKIDLVGELADLAAARDGMAGLSSVLRLTVRPNWDEPFQLAALKGLQTGLVRSRGSIEADPEIKAVLDKLSLTTSPALVAGAWRLARALGIPETETQRKILEQAIMRARDTSQPLHARVADINLLALGKFPIVKEGLFALLEGTQPEAIQQATILVLKEFNDPKIAKVLVEHWRSFASSSRAGALALLLQRTAFHNALIDALEKGQITAGELNLDLEQRRRLLWYSSPDIKARAAKLLGDGEYSNRKSIVGDWLAKLPATGNALRGKPIFEQRCAQCHLVGTLGHRVGPELTGMSHRSVEDLLSNILDPNMAINPAYITYNCETLSGELESGLLQADLAEAVTLLQAAEKKMVIPRANIKRLQSSGLSLMPEGLEAGLTAGELRDLIAFLQERR